MHAAGSGDQQMQSEASAQTAMSGDGGWALLNWTAVFALTWWCVAELERLQARVSELERALSSAHGELRGFHERFQLNEQQQRETEEALRAVSEALSRERKAREAAESVVQQARREADERGNALAAAESQTQALKKELAERDASLLAARQAAEALGAEVQAVRRREQGMIGRVCEDRRAPSRVCSRREHELSASSARASPAVDGHTSGARARARGGGSSGTT